jgi:galactonate dehydratase
MKFDPFGVAWKEMSEDDIEAAIERVAAVRAAVGPWVGLMIEFHGRLSARCAVQMIRSLARFQLTWCEEPVAPESLDLLHWVKQQVDVPIAAGERLYTLADFYRLCSLRAVDVVQMDIIHCGGLWISKKIAAMAAVQDLSVSPHCSVGPVALAACLQFDCCTPNFMIQEDFTEFDVPWRNSLVRSKNSVQQGEFMINDTPGLGVELDEQAIADHPYVKNAFPSLWDGEWLTNFTQDHPEI